MSNTTNNDNPGKVAAFTPGQWRVQPRFCTVYKTTRPDGTGITTAIASPLDGHGEFTQEEREANARLIAAAPDLFEALRDVAMLADQHAERYPGDRDAVALAERVRSAIRKAGGVA